MIAQSSKFGAPQCAHGLESLLDPRLFRALGDPTRLQILACVTRCAGPCSVTDAAKCCNVDFSVVSRHLAILRDAGILDLRKEGRTAHYTVRYSKLSQALRALADAIDACCPAGSCCEPPAHAANAASTSKKKSTPKKRARKPTHRSTAHVQRAAR